MAKNDTIDVSENASYTIDEAAAFLGKSDRHVRRYVKAGKLESAGAGRVTRASVEALAGKNVPALAGTHSEIDTVSVPKIYMEDLAYRVRHAEERARHAEGQLLQLEDKGADEKAALEREIGRFTAELAEVKAELERERKRPLWRRILGRP